MKQQRINTIIRRSQLNYFWSSYFNRGRIGRMLTNIKYKVDAAKRKKKNKRSLKK